MNKIRNLATRMLRWWCDGMLLIDWFRHNLDVDDFKEIWDIALDTRKYVDATPMRDVIKGIAAMIFFAPVMWFAKIHYRRKYRHQKSEEEA